MRKTALPFAAAGLAAAGAVALAAPASAATTYNPNVARIANPANACASIPGTIAADALALGMPAPTLSDFNYARCVSTLARGKAFVQPADLFGDPYNRCDMLVAAGELTYGATLHSGEGGPEDALLPDLTVNNRKECGSALYAYHAIAEAVFGPEG